MPGLHAFVVTVLLTWVPIFEAEWSIKDLLMAVRLDRLIGLTRRDAGEAVLVLVQCRVSGVDLCQSCYIHRERDVDSDRHSRQRIPTSTMPRRSAYAVDEAALLAKYRISNLTPKYAKLLCYHVHRV